MRIHQTAPHLLVRAIALALGIVSFPLVAADYTWVGESGDWDVADNWDPYGVPQGWGDVASILSTDTLNRTISYNTAESSYLDALTLDATGSGKLELVLWGSSLEVAEFLVGSHGHATTVQAGANVFSSNLVVGRHAGSEGNYQLSAGHLWTEDLRLGEMAGSQGRFVWTGGSLDITRLHVGHGGNGTFVQDIGVGYNLFLMPHQQIVIGVEAGSEGVFEQRSGDIYSGYWQSDDAMPIIVGEAGHGTYRHLDGDHYAPTLVIGRLSGSEGSYELTGEHARVYAERTVVADAGTGRFMQAAGEHGASELVIGRAAGSAGVYQFSGGQLWAGDIRLGEMPGSQGSFVWTGGALDFLRLHVGQGGSGSFIQDIGGGNRWELRPDQQIVIGVEAGSEGLFEQRSGNIGVGWSPPSEGYDPLIVGAAGKGTYRHIEGENRVQEVLIGHLAGSQGTYELVGEVYDGGFSPAWLYSERLVVGDAGTGRFVHQAGMNDAQEMVVGRAAGSVGEYQFSGGHLWAWDLRLGEMAGSQGSFVWTGGALDFVRLHVGQGGSGTFVQDIGGGNRWELRPYHQIVIGVEAGSEGLFEQRSGNIGIGWYTPPEDHAPLIVGAAGKGTYRHVEGQNRAHEVLIGHLAGSQGTYELIGEVHEGNSYAWLYSERLVVGDVGAGRFVHQAGNADAEEILIGRFAGSEGRYELAGEHAWLTSQRLVVGDAGTGQFMQAAGTHSAWELVIGRAGGSVGIYELSGGDLWTETTRIGAADGATGTMKVAGHDTRWTNHGTVHVGVDLFSLSTPGSALLELRDGALISADTVIIGESGEVQGDGRIHATVFNQGLLTPGMGALEIFGDYSQAGEGTLFVEIGGYGIGQDFLNIWGMAVLGGSLLVGLLDGYSIGLGDSFDILFASAVYGGFDTLLFPVFNGMTFDISYEFDGVRLTAVSAVPVPAALWLLGSGVLLLFGVARRRQAG
jgi:T5SS/PEP-CTERM-associated repeat protein